MSRVRDPYARFCERDKYRIDHLILYLPYLILFASHANYPVSLKES